MYGLPMESSIQINVYDLSGRVITSLYNGVAQAGFHDVTWNADNTSSGVYFIRLDGESKAGQFTSQQKILLIK